MPRYRYRALAPRLQEWCASQGVEYRVDGEVDILKRNFNLLRSVAKAPAEPGAVSTRAETVWSKRAGAAWVGAS